MTRVNRDFILMDTAFLWAGQSTCSRLNVGCVISRDGRILVQGYNGAPAGLKHCNHDCSCLKHLPPYSDRDHHLPDCNSLQPCTRAVHAEQNAISFAARWGVELKGAHASVTHQPCVSCAQSLINAGITSLDYVEPYRLKDGLDLLEEAGMSVHRLVDWTASRMIG